MVCLVRVLAELGAERVGVFVEEPEARFDENFPTAEAHTVSCLSNFIDILS